MRKLFATALALALLAGPALAQLAPGPLPGVVSPTGPVTAQPVVNIGYDSGTGFPCIVGKTATCSLQGSGGGGGGGASYTAAATPFAVSAGVNKPMGISTFNSAGWFVPVKPGTTTEIDLSGPSGVLGVDGATIATGANPFPTSINGTLPAFAATPTFNCGTGCGSNAVAQGSITSGQSGGLTQAAVTTAAPTYTTAQTSPLSLTTAGALRTDASATTQPVSGTVTAAQATASSLNAQVQGPGASGATTVGNPNLQGCQFVTAMLAGLTTGQTGNVQCDNKGGLFVTQEQAGVPQLWGQTVSALTLSNSVVNAPVVNALTRLESSGSTGNALCDMTNTFCTAGAGVAGVSLYPNSAANAGVVPVVSSALESCHVLKASPGNLYHLSVNPAATAGMILVLNLTSAPGAGAVTPIWSQNLAASGQADFNFSPPIRGSTGLVACVSSAATPFTYTASSTAMISALIE